MKNLILALITFVGIQTAAHAASLPTYIQCVDGNKRIHLIKDDKSPTQDVYWMGYIKIPFFRQTWQTEYQTDVRLQFNANEKLWATNHKDDLSGVKVRIYMNGDCDVKSGYVAMKNRKKSKVRFAGRIESISRDQEAK